MRRAILLIAGVFALAAAGAGVLILTDSAGSADPPRDLVTMSNDGSRVDPSPDMRRVLERVGLAQEQVKLLGRRGATSFYSLGNTSDRGNCYGIGMTHDSLNGITCGRQFPASAPVIDSSIVEENTITGSIRFDQVAGWAVDRVVAVALFDAAGAELLRAPVDGNVYFVDRGDMPAATTKIVAIDRAGHSVWEKSLR